MSAPSWKIWGAIVGIAAVTFLLRFSFIYLLGRIEQVPPRIEHALGFVPAAVLAALSVPAFVVLEPTVVGTVSHPKLLAGLVAAGVAWKTQDVTATVVVGMIVLWTVQYAPI